MVKSTKATTKPQVSSLGRYRNCNGVISIPKPQTSGYGRVRVQVDEGERGGRASRGTKGGRDIV